MTFAVGEPETAVTCVPVTSTPSSSICGRRLPDAERRQAMLSPGDIAAAILYVLGVPAHVRSTNW